MGGGQVVDAEVAGILERPDSLVTYPIPEMPVTTMNGGALRCAERTAAQALRITSFGVDFVWCAVGRIATEGIVPNVRRTPAPRDVRRSW